MATKRKFDAAFIEEFMAEHKRYQHDLENQYINEIIDEVQALPKRKPRTGELFTLLPELEQRKQRNLVVRQ
jgi:hypothetical protein